MCFSYRRCCVKQCDNSSRSNVPFYKQYNCQQQLHLVKPNSSLALNRHGGDDSSHYFQQFIHGKFGPTINLLPKQYCHWGGLVINLPYQAHLPCNITLDNNEFMNNSVTSKIGVDAFQLTASSNTLSASCVLAQLANNRFLQNKVSDSCAGSGNVDFFIHGCNNLTLRSVTNEYMYNRNVGVGNLPGAVGV